MSDFYGLNFSTPSEDLIPPPSVVNDTHKQYSIAVASIVLGITTTFIAFARLGTRFASRTFGADDYAIIPATALYVAWIALAGYMNLNAGIGKPLWEITVGEYAIWYQCILAGLFLYPAMSASVRAAILLLYLRIFAKGSQHRTILLYILLALQGIYVIVFSILPAFVCHPADNVKYPLEHAKYCDDLYYAAIQTGLFSVSLGFDVVLLVVPIFWVLKLQLPLKKRIGLIVIFVLGAGVEWTTTSFQPSKSMYKSIRDIFASSPAVDEMKSMTAGTGIFTLQGISPGAVEPGKLRGGNALGLDPVAQSWFHTDIGWWFPDDDGTAHRAIRSLTDEVEGPAKTQGSYPPYIFMNDASIDQRVIEHYEHENVKKLKEAQNKYDPGAVVPGGFKLLNPAYTGHVLSTEHITMWLGSLVT
ncbi:hypothetical protein AAE478_004943 [Parahypoxylon ruwenzoriense]